MEGRSDNLGQALDMPMIGNKSLGPLTPVSPSLPVAMPPVMEAIPQLPITPPSTDLQRDLASEGILASAVHVLSTEATALSCMARLYQTDPRARDGFAKAVDTIAASALNGGKLIVCGVGKSGKIGEKVVATMNSMGVLTVFLHPVEALHGDLGIIREVRGFLPSSFPLCAPPPSLKQPGTITAVGAAGLSC